MENKIVDLLNKTFAANLFEYNKCISYGDGYPKIEMQCIYKPLNIVIQYLEYAATTINTKNEELGEKWFNEHLMRNIIFSLPTSGSILDTLGNRIYTFADIKEHILLNKLSNI